MRLAEPSGVGNSPSRANPDSATTDETTADHDRLLANDRTGRTSSKHSGLQVVSTDTSGTNRAPSRSTVTRRSPTTRTASSRSLKVGHRATDSFKYRVRRGSRISAPATVTITVNGVNDLPVAHDDTASTDSGHATSIPVLSNDTDADGDSLSVGSVDTAGTQGNVTITGNGTVTYDPNHKFDALGPNDTAHDTFKYKANDGRADSRTSRRSTSGSAASTTRRREHHLRLDGLHRGDPPPPDRRRGHGDRPGRHPARLGAHQHRRRLQLGRPARYTKPRPRTGSPASTTAAPAS